MSAEREKTKKNASALGNLPYFQARVTTEKTNRR